MNEPEQSGPYSELERQLDELFHPGSPDPDFASRLEARLLARIEGTSGQRPQKPQLRTIFFSSPSRMLAWGGAALLLVLALAWVISHLLPVEPPTGGRPALQPSGSPPALLTPGSLPASQTPATQPGLGKLVYVSAGELWVVTLPDSEPQRLTSDGLNREPRWSPSGEWLAFYKGTDQVWISEADGSAAHPLSNAGPLGAFAWSPVKDQIAYVANDGELHLTQAGAGDDRTLVSAVGSGQIARLAFSPDGRWIAFEWLEQAENQTIADNGLWKVPVEGGDPQEVYSGPATLAGWSADGRSLIFWTGNDQYSASMQADGAPLGLATAAGDEPQMLPDTVLVFGDFLSTDPSGSGRLAYIAGAGRETWKDKGLALYVNGHAGLLTSLDRAVSSPAWSFDGSQIAYVSTKSAGQDSSSDAVPRALAGRHIWSVDLLSGETRQLTGDPAYRDERPLWSRDGSQLLFVRLDGAGQASVWMLPAAGGEPRQVVESLAAPQDVGGLSADDRWFGTYGHVDWDELLNWWQPLRQASLDAGPTGAATTEGTTPAPMTPTAGPGSQTPLSLQSSPEEIRQRILDPAWETLWAQGEASVYSPNGLQQNTYVQGWLERPGAGRVLTTDPLFGSLGFTLDMDPRWVWVSDGSSLTLFDQRSGQFDPSAATKEWVSHPLEASGETIGMLFPSYLALRSEELQVVEMSAQAGRPALVVDWAKYRLWVDAKTGVLLRQQTRAEDGEVSSDIALQAVLYDLPLPAGLLNPQDLGGTRFEAPPAALPTPEANLPAQPAPDSPPLKVVFQAITPQGVELFVASDTGADLVQLTHDQSLDVEPACAPDGSRIAFSALREGQKDIDLIDPDGSNEISLTNDPADDSEPAFSPDGTRIAFVSERDGNPEIYVMNLDGTEATRLTDDPANDLSPAWSPDGIQLLFTSDREGRSQIYRMNADGSGLDNLSNSPASDFGPAWSPDGKKIAFYSPDRGGNGQEAIYVMTRDGSDIAPLTGSANLTGTASGRLQRDMAPVWSPDGGRILFYSTREGVPSGIFETRADGSGLLGLELALTPRTLEAANPCWLPAKAGAGSGAASVLEASDGQAGGAYVTFTSGDSSVAMVDLRAGPSTADAILATLPAGSQLPALGKTAAGDWIQVEYPPGSGQTGWVYAPLVTLSGGPLPVVATPAPGSASVEGGIILGYGSHLPAPQRVERA